jgi:putative oxygen-independent coproporphyrinogen III oxidase
MGGFLEPGSEFAMRSGIYVHIPFCVTRCNYCHFITRPWSESIAERYRIAVVREIESSLASEAANAEVDSIYFGGGTPSLVPSEHIADLLGAIRRVFRVSPDCEISLEANPETITHEKANAYRALGVNRVSMGAQSFSDQELKAIGRIHDAAQIQTALRILREAGFENLNLDLILGLPGQRERQWLENIDNLARLHPAHVSIYMLDLDDKSPLYHEVRKGLHTLPDDDCISDLYLKTIDSLNVSGYEQYEISNFAQPGFACRHNLRYWLREPVFGFGVGSHSYDGCSRYANISRLSEYLERLEGGLPVIEWRREINVHEALQEMLFLGLRLNRGVDWHQLASNCNGRDLEEFELSLREISACGLVEWHDSYIRLTRTGMLLSNEVFQRFV